MAKLHDDAPRATRKTGDPAADIARSLPDAGTERHDPGGSVVGRSVTINRPRSELYAVWRDFTNLPRFMENVETVEVRNDTSSHWRVKAPGGKSVEWDAVITEEQPGERLCWSSTEDADVPNKGCVEFRDAGARGTVVTATMVYDPPAGVIGKVIAKIFQREPNIQARRDLRRFKQYMETGEVATAARTRAQLQEEK